MSVYTLPDLPYDYSALAPHISARIMELHHSKHHQAYVTGANTALEQLAEARESGNFANVNKLEKDLAFNLGGHVNHSIFWTNLSPNGGGEATGSLATAIDAQFARFIERRPASIGRRSRSVTRSWSCTCGGRPSGSAPNSSTSPGS